MTTAAYAHVINSMSIKPEDGFAEKFFSTEPERMKGICEEISKDGITMDYTILSIPSVTKWLIGRAKTIHDTQNKDIDNNEIKDFILDAAYYMGQSFIRSTHTLSWEVNTKESLLPKIKGFKFGICMCPITDIHEIFENTMKNKQALEDVERTLLAWLIKI